MLDTLTGADTDLQFSDVLNLRETRPEAPKVVLHEAMEIKFGL